jgi:hypothetical protein
MSNYYISKCCGALPRTEEICSTCLCSCEVIAVIDTPGGVPEANFIQVGRTQICGHCNPKRFGEGLKQALEINPNYVCECVCHDDVKQYQEDIEAGVDVGEPDELQEKEHELMNKVYSSGRESMKSEIISKIMGMATDNEILLLDAAKIINKIRNDTRFKKPKRAKSVKAFSQERN